jgi:hypothetical protein
MLMDEIKKKTKFFTLVNQVNSPNSWLGSWDRNNHIKTKTKIMKPNSN